MNIASISCFLVFACTVGSSVGSKLCQDDHWYDAGIGKCQACAVCDRKSLELEPCAEFKNTICVNLSIFKFDLKHPHKWHEMETMDEDGGSHLRIEVKEVRRESKVVSALPKSEWYNLWDTNVFLVLCAALIILIGATFVLMLRQPRDIFKSNGSKNNKRTSRFRLFSRDRLSTTEYMNNLATLDRRLAMDEILEKRQKAIFDPQLLPQNMYADEVFIDISGLPHHYYEDLRVNDNDQDPTRSLLKSDQSRP